MDDKKCIEFLNLGIAEKRNGNYEKAILYYEKAKEYNPLNSNIYYNSGKLHIGLGNTTEAIKHLLVYLHLSIYNNSSIDPISGNRLFKNLLAPDYDDPIKQQLYMNNLDLFNYINKYGKSIITDTIVIQGDPVGFLCLVKGPLQLCVLDQNLSFYAGLCYVLNDKIIQIFNDITEDELIDLKNGILAKQYKNLIRNTYKEKLFYVLGFLYLAINLKRIKNTLEIPNYYLGKEFQINKDIENFKDYLYRPDSI